MVANDGNKRIYSNIPFSVLYLTISMSVYSKNQYGFTIIELLITLMVLSIAFTSFMTIFLTIDGVSDRTFDLVTANDAAFTKMQEYENRDYLNIPVGDIASNYEVEDFTSSLSSDLKNPSGKVFAQYEGLSLTLKRVDVRVTYEVGNDPKVIEYANLIQISGVGR